MTNFKREIDAYFFGIESDEAVALSDQFYFYGSIAFGIATVCFALLTFINK